MPKSKLSALISLLLVFASGVLVGVVGHRLYVVNTVAVTAPPKVNQRPDPEEARRRIVSDMKEKIKLDDQQLVELNRIYDETRQAFDQLHREGSAKSRALWENQKSEIRAMLRPDQVPLYDKWQAERDAMHKRDRDRRPGGPGRGPGPGPDDGKK